MPDWYFGIFFCDFHPYMSRFINLVLQTWIQNISKYCLAQYLKMEILRIQHNYSKDGIGTTVSIFACLKKLNIQI